jgi:hypothetical protein
MATLVFVEGHGRVSSDSKSLRTPSFAMAGQTLREEAVTNSRPVLRI